MTIEISTCSGGVAQVPDMRGSKECYSDSTPYESLVITQIPEPGSLVDAGQTVINVLTEDGQGNATVCTHYLNVTADNPAPTLECPEPITAWLLAGGVEVPDYTKVVDIIGGCTVYDDLIITQSPEAGTFLTTAGVHTISISVTDKFGHTVVCGETTITITDPNPLVTPVTPPPTPVTPPVYIYPVNLLAYWRLDDFAFLLDSSPGGRDLTNLGSASSQPSQTVLNTDCHPPFPGPIFHSGSAYFNRSNTAGFTRADDAGLRLLATSWTIRFGIKVIAADAGLEKRIINKRLEGGGSGYKIYVQGFGGSYNIVARLYAASIAGIFTVSSVSFSANTWYVVTLTFDDTLGVLKIYRDGVVVDSQTNLGAHITGSAEPFVIGEQTSGTSMESYVDEIGMWSEAWTPARVLDDFHALKCMS